MTDTEDVRRRLEVAIRLLEDMIDDEPCWLDHHGGCQAHGYFEPVPGERCPQQEAKEFLAS